MVIKTSTKMKYGNMKFTHGSSVYFDHSHSPKLKGRIHYDQVQL